MEKLYSTPKYFISYSVLNNTYKIKYNIIYESNKT